MSRSRAEYLDHIRENAPKGEQCGSSKLEEGDVRWIRLNRHGLTAKQQAAVLGVHHRTVEKVRHYETWGHVK